MVNNPIEIWVAPAAMAVTGVRLSVNVPLPRLPYMFVPQHSTLPEAVSAQVC